RQRRRGAGEACPRPRRPDGRVLGGGGAPRSGDRALGSVRQRRPPARDAVRELPGSGPPVPLRTGERPGPGQDVDRDAPGVSPRVRARRSVRRGRDRARRCRRPRHRPAPWTGSRRAGGWRAGDSVVQRRRRRRIGAGLRGDGVMTARLRARRRGAIVGAAPSPFPGRTDVPLGALTVQTVLAAIADAGLEPGQIDGYTTGAIFPSSAGLSLVDGVHIVTSDWLVQQLGAEPRWLCGFQGVGQIPGSVILAAGAVATRAADYVLLHRAMYNPPTA